MNSQLTENTSPTFHNRITTEMAIPIPMVQVQQEIKKFENFKQFETFQAIYNKKVAEHGLGSIGVSPNSTTNSFKATVVIPGLNGLK